MPPGSTTSVTLGAQNITGQPEQVTGTVVTQGGTQAGQPEPFTAPAEGTGSTTVSVTAPSQDGTYPVTSEESADGTALPPVTLTLLVVSPGDLSPFFNNTGISDDSDQAAGNLDGIGSSLSYEALQSVGINPGGTVTASGLSYTWPNVPAGQPDNVVAEGQTVNLAPQPGATELGFLGTATYGPSQGTATVTYTDGSTQQVTIGFSDWTSDSGLLPGEAVAATMPYRNKSSGSSQTAPTYLYTMNVALEAGKTVASVTLPANVNGELHVFAIATG